MRILIANDSSRDAGGIHSYLERVIPALAAAGHEMGFLQCVDAVPFADGPPGMPYFNVEREGLDAAIDGAKRWQPDVCYSNQVGPLKVERRLFGVAPMVKIAHGHYGTCIGGHKMHLFPSATPCNRVFGPACFALYLPRHCGQLRVGKLLEQYRGACEQNDLLDQYATIITTSEYMRREYIKHGIPPERLQVNALFPTEGVAEEPTFPTTPRKESILFLGRMTAQKGGDVLLRAVAIASRELGRRVPVVMGGEGSARANWTELARHLEVEARFPGWVEGRERTALLESATLMAVPSVWHEPFGLVGLEANRFGVPAIAFDVGGICEWLRDGVNGFLVNAAPPTAEAFAAAIVKALRNAEVLEPLRRGALEMARTLSIERHVDSLEETLRHAATQRIATLSR
jgi:glycosyltransferase involved in cell wall biosynthesis